MDKVIKPQILIVDENDNVIGSKDRGILEKDDIYRVSALWITNNDGKILLARRHRSKSHHPRKWGPAVAGTVEEDETYEKNIIKEAKEELGLNLVEFTLGPKLKTENEYKHFTQWYFFTLDKDIKDFKIQEDEVEEVKWFSKEELKKQIEENAEEFLPTMKNYYDVFVHF